MHGEEEMRVEAPTGHAVDEADAPFLDIEDDRLMQAYNLLKIHSCTLRSLTPTFSTK